MKFTIHDRNKMFWGLIILELCLLLIFVGDVSFGPIRGIHGFFDLGGEANIPAWFSSTQLLVIGILFFIISRQLKANKVHRPSSTFLLFVTIGFIFLSMDETAQIHERITELFKTIKWIPRFAGNHGIWIPIYLIGIMIFCIATFPEIFAMWKNYKYETLLLTIGIGIFLLGAVGLEIISYMFLRGSGRSVFYELEVGFEEFLEMFGASVIFYGTSLFALRNGFEQS